MNKTDFTAARLPATAGHKKHTSFPNATNFPIRARLKINVFFSFAAPDKKYFLNTPRDFSLERNKKKARSISSLHNQVDFSRERIEREGFGK